MPLRAAKTDDDLLSVHSDGTTTSYDASARSSHGQTFHLIANIAFFGQCRFRHGRVRPSLGFLRRRVLRQIFDEGQELGLAWYVFAKDFGDDQTLLETDRVSKVSFRPCGFWRGREHVVDGWKRTFPDGE